LTEHGHLEAKALAERLASGIVQRVPSRLYSSPMGRARATSKYVEDALNLTAEVEEWTKELSDWGRISSGGLGKPGEGGLALWDIPGEFIRSFEPSLTSDSQWDLFEDMASVREDYNQLCAHSDSFLARHGYVREGGKYRILKPSEDQIAVFCHGGFGLTWLAHLLQIPVSLIWSSFHLPPSSVTTVLFDQRSDDYATPRVIGLGDVSHLYKAGLEIPMSRYEKPNPYSNNPRPSGVKGNFW